MEKIYKEDINQVVTEGMGEYSTYVLLSRAIPSIKDGLKPVYRRILWTMKEMNATKLTKSSKVTGQVMGNYHPHSTSYPSIVSMTQSDSQQNPYLSSKGNLGQHTSELAYASERYSEVKLSPYSIDLMEDTNKKGVEMIDNYDNTRKIPEAFPVKFPNILVNAQSGIGVGFSSSIPSFNITELCQSIILFIESGDKQNLIPDFATKATVINDKNVIESINKTGRGSILQRAKAEIIGNEIIVTEIPYDTTKEKIINKILSLYKDKKLPEIKNVEDMSGLEGLEIIISAKKNTDMEQLLEKLYLTTPMQASYSANMMVINTEGLPKLMGVWDIIIEWIEWRKQVIIKMLKHDTEIKKRSLEVLYGLKKIEDNIDEVIETIRKSTDDNVIKNLMKEFELSELQAERISELKLRNLTTTFILKQMKNINTLESEIVKNEKVIGSDKELDKYITKDLKDVISKFGKERQSVIIDKKDIVNKSNEIDLSFKIDDYNVRVFVTKDNYIKKIPLTSLRGDFDIQIKAGDEIIDEVETTNSEEILVFTDKNNVYKKRLYEIADSKPSGLGTFVPNEISLEKNETIESVLILSKNARYVLFGFEDGKVAKVDVDAYRTKQNRSILRNAHANKSVILFKLLSEDIDLLAIADNTKTVLMNTSTINSKSSKTAQGSAFIKLKKDSAVSEYQIIDNPDDYEYYRVKSAGAGKYKK